MVLMPPGSAKSTYANVQFVPHWLGLNPRSAVLSCSHSTEKAEEFGRRSRNLIEVHGRMFLGFGLVEWSRSAGRWETEEGGTFFSAGVGSAIAGYRADLGVIDDPIRNKEDADSQLVRDKQWDWFNFDFKTRLKPDAVIVFIYTTWHEDDLGHRILAAEGKDWTILRLPFFAEENDPLNRDPKVENGYREIGDARYQYPRGELLWPEWFKKEMYPIDDTAATALYQLRPTPETGDYFKRDWLVEYTHPDQLPKQLRIYVGSDHALTKREENDRHCLLPVGLDANDDIWVLPDVWWKRADTGELVEAMIDLMERRRPIEWFAEEEHVYKAIGPFLNKRMVERRVYTAMTGITSNKDLMSRAQSVRGRMKMCKVHFPAFAHWWHEAKHELLSFPVGLHDDFVAALAKLGQGLEKMARPSKPEEERPEVLHRPFIPTLAWLKRQDKLARRRLMPRYGDR